MKQTQKQAAQMRYKKNVAKQKSTASKSMAPKKTAKPVYKTGMLSSGQPRNYATSKKGTISSID